MPSSPSASTTPSAMAWFCLTLPPEQMTKKSVKPAAFRRSRTTTSSAFLPAAAAIARSIWAGSFAVARRLSVFAMQSAGRGRAGGVGRAPAARAREIQSVLLNVLLDDRRDHALDRPAGLGVGPDGAGRHIRRLCVDQNNPGLARRNGVIGRRHPRRELGKALLEHRDRRARPRDDCEVGEIE